MSLNLRIALDFSHLDSIGGTGGQYRYVTDRVRSLAGMQTDFDFLLLGSRTEPVEELSSIFQNHDGRWRYHQMPGRAFRAAGYLDHARYGLVLRRERIDLLHSLHTFIPLLAPCPVVVTLYDLMYELFDEYRTARESRTYRLHRWSVKHRARRVLCISETTATDLRRKWNVADDRIDVTPLGTRFKPNGNHQKSDRNGGLDSLLILSPFNLEPRKNLDALLQAIALLAPNYPNIRLKLFGRAAVTPERQQNFERRIEELSIQNKVLCTGVLSDEDLVALYASATLFVFPSLYEGFGLPLIEAMSAGACVIGRNASAMTEVVGEAGVLVETKDPKELSSAIHRLLSDGDMRTALGRLGQERAQSFTVERMANLTHQSYLKALDKPSL